MRTIAIVCVVCVLAGFLLFCDVLEAGGERGVIGVRITVENEWLTVLATLDNSPAGRKGLRAGDRIVRIDGQSTEGRTLPDCLGLLAGPPGEDVTLTVVRRPGDKDERFDVTLTRESMNPDRRPFARSGQHSRPVGKVEPVQWKGNKIVSRMLPYPDFMSLFIRLPIAHAAATGKGVSVAVIRISEDRSVLSVIEHVAPNAEVKTCLWDANKSEAGGFIKMLSESSIRIALISDVHLWPERRIVELAKRLIAENIAVVIPSDLSEDETKIETVNTLHGIGALTVGRVDRQSLVMQRTRDGTKPFNRRIRSIHTDVFSTIGLSGNSMSAKPAAAVAGIVALVLEKWPDMTVVEIRERVVSGARQVWQCTSIETGQWQPNLSVDPVTTEYKPKDERAIFRFRAVDAAGALGVDTEIPWFLNMLNCHKAWEITKGRGTTVVVSDQGFHIRHPELKDRIQTTEHFGMFTFESEQNFHGTDMSRILLSVAPEAKIIPVLCSIDSIQNRETIVENIARSFRYAAEQKADVITSSWSARFNDNEQLLSAVRYAVDNGVLVSWFHYPESYPGVLRSSFTYSQWETDQSLGFADRFLADPPGFHPVEIEAGLSGTAPQAAGIAALVKSVNPALSPEQIEQLIFRCGEPIGNSIVVPDAYKAVLAAKQPDFLEGDRQAGGGK